MTPVAVSLLAADRLPQPSSPSTHPVRCIAIPRPKGPHGFKLPRKLKRDRPSSDVDGPDTLHASRKKRRLRSRLITSPLARPFSQPATHIPHRAGRPAPCAVPRPRKTATPTSAHATRSCSYLRFSLMNRLRQRLGIQTHRHALHAARDAETSTRAPWLPDSIPPAHAPAHAPAGLASRLSKSTGAVGLLSADHAATMEHIASRIYPAPMPRQRRPSGDDLDDDAEQGDEDGFAFLHLEYDFGIDDEGDDGAGPVYCDFDAVFGTGAVAVSSEQGGDHTYEEYMDGLDGIAWRIR